VLTVTADSKQTDAVGDIEGETACQCHRECTLQLSCRECSQAWTNKRLSVRLRPRPRSVFSLILCSVYQCLQQANHLRTATDWAGSTACDDKLHSCFLVLHKDDTLSV